MNKVQKQEKRQNMSKLTFRLDQLQAKKARLQAEVSSVVEEIKAIKLEVAVEKKAAKAK